MNNIFYYILYIVSLHIPLFGIAQTTYVSKEGQDKREKVIELLENLRDWKTFNIEGKDKNGKTVEFSVIILTQTEEWDYSAKDKTKFGIKIDYALPRQLNKKIKEINHSKELICVGTASQEGTRSYEKSRAKKRAYNIRRATRKFLKKKNISKKMHILNLGKFKNKKNLNTTKTSYQRKIIIITINKNSDYYANISNALKNAIINDDNVKFLYEDYFEFEFEKDSL